MSTDQQVLRIIQEDPNHRKFFLRKAKDPKWFYPLQELDIFDVTRLPEPEGVDEVGRRINLEWDALPYLINLSSYVRESTDTKLGKELLKLIKKIGPVEPGNFITRSGVLKMLQNIPSDLLDEDSIGIICNWISDKDWRAFYGPELPDEFLYKLASSDTTIFLAEKLFVALTTLNVPKIYDTEKSFRSTDCKLYLDPFWLEDGIEKHSTLIAEKLSLKVYSDLRDKIKFLLLRNIEHNPITETLKNLHFRLGYTEGRLEIKIQNQSGNNVYSKVYKETTTREEVIRQTCQKLVVEPAINPDDYDEVAFLLHQLHVVVHREQTLFSLRHERHYDKENPLNILPLLLRNLLDERIKFHPKETKKFLTELLDEDFLIFPKIVLYLVGQHPTKLRDVFWSALSSRNRDVIFEDLVFGDELKYALQELPPLSESERTLLKEKIETGSQTLNYGEDEERVILWKQQRYRALSKDPEFLEEYEAIKARTGKDWELGPGIGPVESRWGPGPSGISVERLLSFSIPQVVDHLSNFKPSGSWEGPSIGGLAETLEAAVTENPQHFTENLSPFLETAYIWITRLLRGFFSAKKQNKDVDWKAVATFAENLTDSNKFWDINLPVVSEDSSFTPTFEWVLADLARLVEAMIENDNTLVESSTVQRFKAILRKSISRLQPSVEPSYEEPVIQAINSTVGKLLKAIFKTTLYQARNQLIPKRGEISWEDDDKDILDNLLQEKIGEAWTLIGLLFPNLTYLDKAWAENVAKNRTTTLDNPLWFNFFTGYLHHARFYDVTYTWMRSNYERALTEKAFDDESSRVLAQHLTLAYLRKHEEINSQGIFDRFIQNASTLQLQNVLSFLKFLSMDMSKDENIPVVSDHKFSPRVISLWRKLDKTITKHKIDGSSEANEALAAISGLTRFLPEINEEFYKLLQRSVGNFSSDVEHPFFLEHLVYLKNHSKGDEMRKWTGLLILDLLKVCTPSFHKEHIEELVEWIYQGKNTKHIADEICNIYARRGSEILVPLYRNYNST